MIFRSEALGEATWLVTIGQCGLPHWAYQGGLLPDLIAALELLLSKNTHGAQVRDPTKRILRSSRIFGGEMADQYLLGWILASVLGLVALYRTLVKRNDDRRSALAEKRSECVKSVMVSNGECRSIDGDVDVIIVGAGVAGAALAHTLGKDGRRVHVIERDLQEPDRIVGELLQPGGYLKLIELGLEDCVEEIDAQRVFGYALFKDGKNTKLSYPLEKFHSDVSGRSFHNGRFIQRMREKAATLPNVQLEQGTVTSLLEEKGTIKGVQYKNKTGQEMTAYAPLTIVCDGCFSNLRRSLCDPKVDVPSCFVGLILENCDLPHANHGHVILADPSPILFYQISSTEVRCLVDVPGQKVPSISNGEMAKYLKAVVAPQDNAQQKHASRSLSYSWSTIDGDAFNMRHPLTGGGMTVALSDIVVLQNLLRPLTNLNDASTLSKYLESFYTLRKGPFTRSFLLHLIKRGRNASGLLRLPKSRGVFSNGPVSLLSGLNPRPLSLVLHFFAVAVYGVGRLLLPFPSPKRAWIGARLISSASGIIFPIIKAEGVRQMFFPATVPAYYRAPVSSEKQMKKTEDSIN
ncbi:FAD/NAD(P)-binding oxidoreductase family protein [Prunus dulcis]|uniref:Squalene monooxygenase n=1 Tax=Prunus dulcis TaxID=3755 RepID=A0A4Y1QTF0_PRUDU|nr:FAD/NAD(P)-binding oxidoreductase family protein [Prunus dulcis]